jgi:pyroglutamyl-peptidase
MMPAPFVHSSRCRLLLTGFGPFPGVPRNVSATVAERLGHAVRWRFPSAQVVWSALPTEWHVAPAQVGDLVLDLKPRLALHFGVSDLASGFVIETIARNQAGRMDAAGLLPTMPFIDPFGPAEMATQLPAARLQARLRKLGLPVRLSRDAGAYLCNAVFYRSVLAQRATARGGRSGFIHLPVIVAEGRSSSSRHAPLDIDRALRGGVEIVAACLNH